MDKHVLTFFVIFFLLNSERRVLLRRGPNGFGFNIVGGDGEEGKENRSEKRLFVLRSSNKLVVSFS